MIPDPPAPALFSPPIDVPLVAATIHEGHQVRDELAPLLAVTPAVRFREEDPFTALWTEITDGRIVGLRSRFEVDLNRPRDRAVYLSPDDAWGIRVWKRPPDADGLARSRSTWDVFYSELESFLEDVERRFGRFVVLDLHSYNHRRSGPWGSPADPGTNPEINVGTGTMVRERWSGLVDRFLSDLRDASGLDVRENVKFFGGEFPRWIHSRFPHTGCCLAVEVKKTFMDEWTGEPVPERIAAVEAALAATLPGLVRSLETGAGGDDPHRT